MHPSYFSASTEIDEEPGAVMELSPALSEWLFHKKLWDQVNHGTELDLAQFEEEHLSGPVLRTVYDELVKLRAMLMQGDHPTIDFRYGWDADKAELICRLDVRAALKELQELMQFFKSAADNGLQVYCSL